MNQINLWLPPPVCVLSSDGGGKDGLGWYRYSLRIPLSSASLTRVVLFVLANPSTAVVGTDGKFQSDPTITKCMSYARSWGYGTLLVGNVRAWRETDPEKVPSDPEAIGPRNDSFLITMAMDAVENGDGLVVCGWGKLGGAERSAAVIARIREAGARPHALKLNKDGSPAHVLYLPSSLIPFPMGATMGAIRARGSG